MNQNPYRNLLPFILIPVLLAGCVVITPKSDPFPKPPLVSKPNHPQTTKLEPILRLDTGGHTNMINDLLVTSDKKYLISASYDKTIRVLDTQTKREARKILGQIEDGLFGQIFAIALSPDDDYLAVGGYLDRNLSYIYAIRIYHFPTGRLIHNLKSHLNVVVDLVFSADGRYLVSGSGDNTVKVWDATKDFKLVHTFREHQDSVYAVMVFPYHGDYRIVSAGLNNHIFLYSLNQKDVLASFSHKDMVYSLTVSRKYIASAGFDNKINIFDLNLQHIKTIDSETNPIGLTFSPDGKLLLAGTGARPLHCNIYDTEQNFKKIQSFRKHDNLTRAVSFLNNDTAITGGGNNMDIYLWNPRTGEAKGHVAGDGETVWSVGISGNKINFGNNNRWKWEKSFNLTAFQVSKPQDFSGFHRISTQYKDYTLSCTIGGPYGYTGAVLLIKKQGKIIHRIARDSINGLGHRTYSFTQDGIILSGGSNGILKAYNLEGEEIANFVGHTGEVWSIATDGNWMVSGGDDQVIKLWNLKELHEGKKEIFPTLNLFVSRDNEWVAWTKEGFFNASPGGVKYIGYHINQGHDKEAEYVGVEQLYDLFYQPDLLAKRLKGGHENEIQAELDRIGDIRTVLKSGLPPVVKLIFQPEIKQNKCDFTLGLNITDQGGGIGNIIYRVNGVTVGKLEGYRPVNVPGRKPELSPCRTGKIL